jgi:hypothetical protein
MVWCNKGFYAIKVAYFVVSFPWIYAIVYLVIIGNLHGTEPDNIFRPSVVSSTLLSYKPHNVLLISTGAGSARNTQSTESLVVICGRGRPFSLP